MTDDNTKAIEPRPPADRSGPWKDRPTAGPRPRDKRFDIFLIDTGGTARCRSGASHLPLSSTYQSAAIESLRAQLRAVGRVAQARPGRDRLRSDDPCV